MLKLTMKKFALVTGVIAAMGTISAFAQTNEDTLTKKERQESKSNYMYQQLMNSFGNARSGEQEYPDYYAGAYIDDDGGLVVLYKEGEEQNVSLLDSLSGEASYSVQTRKYSYNELLDAKHKISALLADRENLVTEEREAISKVQSYYIIQKANKVFVAIEGLNKDTQDLLIEKIGDSDIVAFEEAFVIEEQTTKNLGEGVYWRVSGNTVRGASIGFRCKKGTSSGFTTTGHGALPVGTTIYSDTNLTDVMGTVDSYMYGTSGDVAFVKSGATISTYVYNSPISLVSNHWVTTASEGSTMYRSGQYSGYGSGTIISTSYDYQMNSTTIGDTFLVRTNKAVQNGDSGGLGFMYINGDYVPAGTINAGGTGSYEGQQVDVIMFTKASNTVNKLNVSPY